MIDQQSTVHMARLTRENGSTGIFTVLSQPMTLRRLERNSKDQTKTALIGSLGSYERTIIRAAFSKDSRILVAGDLSGYLDSWVLAGDENLNQKGSGSEMAHDSASSSSSSEDDMPRRHSKRDHTVIFGQYWTRNPSASLIPTLPSAAVILSFRSASDSQSTALTHRTKTIHPTRHNPHLLSHNIPVVEDRLLVVTAQHQVYEFNILKGSLTPWSRRNPISSFPDEFKRVRDRAMGCIWDINADRERVWIYGSSWLFMFDLSKNFVTKAQDDQAHEEDKLIKRKRKRAKEDEGDHRAQISGAGDKIPESKLLVAFGRKMRKFTGPNNDNHAVVELDPPYEVDSHSVEEASGELELARSRRGFTEAAGQLQTGSELENGEASKANSSDVVNYSKSGPSSTFWHTYRYRPILGAVPISGTDMEDANTDSAMKVAIIERPSWDVDLPPRFYGDQEWNS